MESNEFCTTRHNIAKNTYLLSRSTVYRHIAKLEKWGFVYHHKGGLFDGQYFLTPDGAEFIEGYKELEL